MVVVYKEAFSEPYLGIDVGIDENMMFYQYDGDMRYEKIAVLRYFSFVIILCSIKCNKVKIDKSGDTQFFFPGNGHNCNYIYGRMMYWFTL